MKTNGISKISLIVVIFITSNISAQIYNWAGNTSNRKNILSVTTGLESGMIYGIGYGRIIETEKLQIISNMELTVLAGKDFLDDYKFKTGLAIKLFDFKSFVINTKTEILIRRYENDLAQLMNMSFDVALNAGYYRNRWYLLLESGIDMASATHFKHKEKYKEQFAKVSDGWYDSITGNRIYYGIAGGYSTGGTDVFIRAGKTGYIGAKTNVTLPFYGVIGCNIKI